MIKLLNVITGLDTGGAEIMLYNFLQCLDKKRFEAEVISLTEIGAIGEKMRSLNVPVRALGMRRSVPNPIYLLRLAQLVQQSQADIVQTWLYHADLMGGIAATMRGIPVVWSLHASHLDPQGFKTNTWLTMRACSFLSQRMPARILCTSTASLNDHAEIGYAADKMQHVPNGIDTSVFRPQPAASLSVRQELELAEDTIVIGLMARFHPQKDHFNFIQAASKLLQRSPQTHFLLAGNDITWENSELVAPIQAEGISKAFHLLGCRDDMPRLQASLDIATCSSGYGESFPLAIAEAMACGVPCVVTNLGDLAKVVGDTGRVVPVKDAQALADAWWELIQMSRQQRQKLGLLARQRIEENFSLQAVVAQYEAVYEQILGIKHSQSRLSA